MTKVEQVYQMLEKVYDPELDEPLTDLNFIDRVEINGQSVHVVFRLPTYWCSPNFAYIMAEDIRKYVSELGWVTTVQVSLLDHCASDEINKGVTNGQSFNEVFSGLSDGDLQGLRRIFDIKAYYARQEKLLKYLLNRGMTEEEIIGLSIQKLKNLPLPEKGELLRDKYLEKKKALNHSSLRAVTTPEEEPLTKKNFKDYLRGAKRTRMSMEFNAHYCRGLLEARYNLPPYEEVGLVKE
ncbi:iron-sulfur cluster assembly protein [Siminovitchia sp. 179-K 8D1 HS]|uniref:iron-sulfur cluster assembly protein n=1 Tax=Siminovitchia sp. 179-K 8D1 HS TaxID=3142385 RepID=UPI0039A38225